MPTQIKDGQLVADPTAEQAHDAADTTIQQVRDFTPKAGCSCSPIPLLAFVLTLGAVSATCAETLS